MEQRRLYPDMTAEEQLQWVTDFEALMQDGGGRIIDMARRRQTQWQPEDALTVRRLVGMLAAWPFAQDFAEKAQRYGDYMARATRLPVYVDKVMERLADGLTMTDKDGRTVAYVSPSAPLRRRGRPSREELAARQRGEQPQGAEPDDAEARRRRTVARMLGLDVIVSGSAPREKNNAELKAERDRRRAEYERQNPSLFGGENNTDSSSVVKGASVTSAPGAVDQEVTTPPAGSADRREGQPAEGGLSCPTMSEVYQSRIDQDRLRLSDLAWLCSDELRQRIPTVQSLRVTAESSSERAKTMADMGAKPEDIEPYSQQAKDATEAYLAIYAAVDEELAIQFKRLSLDQPYIDRFRARFKGVDIEKVLHICRPYYEKIREQEKQRADEMTKKGELTIDERIRLLIERDNPEYAARMKAEQAKKEEVADILRYLKRKDKDASDTRLKTAKEVKFPRLVELIGEKEAADYLPLIAYIEEENRKWREAKGKNPARESSGTGSADSSDATASEDQVPVPSDSPAPKERKKPASKKPKSKETNKAEK